MHIQHCLDAWIALSSVRISVAADLHIQHRMGAWIALSSGPIVSRCGCLMCVSPKKFCQLTGLTWQYSKYRYYSRVLPPSGTEDAAVLDMCSSWVSHYPEGYKLGRISGDPSLFVERHCVLTENGGRGCGVMLHINALHSVLLCLTCRPLLSLCVWLGTSA